MCWMAMEHSDDGNAVRKAMRKVREHQERSGGHAWGYAVWDGDLTIHKQAGRLPPFPDWPDGHLAIGHTRFSTRGNTFDPRNAHPFGVEKDGELVAALTHNGTWLDAPHHEWKSDTYLMAEYLETEVQTNPIDDAVKSLAEKTGETFLVLTNEGTGYVHSGRFEITADPIEPAIASSGHRPIRDGDIFKLEPVNAADQCKSLVPA